jgi:hypothetical protein
MNKPDYPILPVIAFFLLTLFIFIPGTIYLTNSLEFTNGYLNLVLVGTCLSLVFALVFWLIFMALRAAGSRFLEKGLALLFSVAFLVWLQANFLLWKYGPLDGRIIDWSKLKIYGYIDSVIWIGLLMAALIFSPFFIRIAKKICLILIFIQLSYGMFLFFNQPKIPSFQQFSVDTTKKFNFSKNKNVILVILDSFPTDVFQEIIQRNPSLAEDFDGFTYYRNSLGGYPFTELSVALILTGKYYDNSMPFEEWKKDAYMSASIPHVLKSAGWEVDVYPKVSYSLYYSDGLASNFIKGVSVAEKMFNIAQIYDLTLFRCLPHFIKPYIYNNQTWLFKRLSATIMGNGYATHKLHSTRNTGPESMKKLRRRHLFTRRAFWQSADIQFISQMLAGSTTTDTPGTFKFYHLGMPHLPLLLDENINYRPMPVNRQNYTRYATAAVKLMITFLEHLQEMGIYENSLVFIMGDHGAGGQQQKFVLQPGMPTVPGQHIVTDQMRISALPLILFKPSAAHGKLQISDAPVSLGDVQATVFSDLGLPANTAGTPMRALDQSSLRERRFFRYSGRDIFSYYGDMVEYFVTGFGWLDESWRPSGRIFTSHGVAALPR